MYEQMFENFLTYPPASGLLEVEHRFDSHQEEVMSRIHRGDRTVHVKCTEGQPEQFIWRDRLYRVQKVLQEWDRTPSWWQDVRGLADGPAGGDEQTWRVEASAGRYDSTGVYDLKFVPSRAQWQLVRTFD